MNTSMRISKLKDRDGNNCFLCDEVLPAGDTTIEHLIPKAHGGSDALENTALSHSWCNRKRGTHPIPVFRAYVAYVKLQRQSNPSRPATSMRKWLISQGYIHNDRTMQWEYKPTESWSEHKFEVVMRDATLKSASESLTMPGGVATRPVEPPSRAVSATPKRQVPTQPWHDLQCHRCGTFDDVDLYPPLGVRCYACWRVEERLDVYSKRRAKM